MVRERERVKRRRVKRVASAAGNKGKNLSVRIEERSEREREGAERKGVSLICFVAGDGGRLDFVFVRGRFSILF